MTGTKKNMQISEKSGIVPPWSTEILYTIVSLRSLKYTHTETDSPAAEQC